MYKIATKQDVDRLLQYLEQDLKNCLYSYIDLKKFGIENPNLTVYFDEDERNKNVNGSMIGDGLSHTSFGAFSIATVLNIAPLEFALPIVMVISL